MKSVWKNALLGKEQQEREGIGQARRRNIKKISSCSKNPVYTYKYERNGRKEIEQEKEERNWRWGKCMKKKVSSRANIKSQFLSCALSLIIIISSSYTTHNSFGLLNHTRMEKKHHHHIKNHSPIPTERRRRRLGYHTATILSYIPLSSLSLLQALLLPPSGREETDREMNVMIMWEGD